MLVYAYQMWIQTGSPEGLDQPHTVWQNHDLKSILKYQEMLRINKNLKKLKKLSNSELCCFS